MNVRDWGSGDGGRVGRQEWSGDRFSRGRSRWRSVRWSSTCTRSAWQSLTEEIDIDMGTPLGDGPSCRAFCRSLSRWSRTGTTYGGVQRRLATWIASTPTHWCRRRPKRDRKGLRRWRQERRSRRSRSLIRWRRSPRGITRCGLRCRLFRWRRHVPDKRELRSGGLWSLSPRRRVRTSPIRSSTARSACRPGSSSFSRRVPQRIQRVQVEPTSRTRMMRLEPGLQAGRMKEVITGQSLGSSFFCPFFQSIETDSTLPSRFFIVPT